MPITIKVGDIWQYQPDCGNEGWCYRIQRIKGVRVWMLLLDDEVDLSAGIDDVYFIVKSALIRDYRKVKEAK